MRRSELEPEQSAHPPAGLVSLAVVISAHIRQHTSAYGTSITSSIRQHTGLVSLAVSAHKHGGYTSMSVEVGGERVKEWEVECRRGKRREEECTGVSPVRRGLEECTGVCLVCVGVSLEECTGVSLEERTGVCWSAWRGEERSVWRGEERRAWRGEERRGGPRPLRHLTKPSLWTQKTHLADVSANLRRP